MKNDVYTVRRFIKNGVDVNRTDNMGRTPLHWASHLKEEQIVEELIKAKAKVNLKDKSADTPLTLVHNSGRYDRSIIVDLVNAGADYNYNRRGDWSLVHDALVDHESDKVLQALLSHGLDPNGRETDNSAPAKPQKGNPYICVAASFGTVANVNDLLQHGANPNVKDLASEPAVFRAVGSGLGMLQTFVEHGANVNSKDPKGETLLAYAVAESKGPNAYLRPHLAEQIQYLRAHKARMH